MSLPVQSIPASRRVEAHGLGVHVTEWPGARPPIVMLHALGFTGRLFDPIARSLSPLHQVLCPDLRGHGRTDHPPEGYQYPNLVRDLVTVLQILHLPEVVLLGHTWGADIAMTFAATHPKRVKGLILIDGGYRYRRESPEPPPVVSPERGRPGMRFASLAEALEDARIQLGIPWNDDLKRAVEDSLDVGRDRTVSYRLDDDRWARIYKALWAYDPSPFLKDVQGPTLLVHPAGEWPATAEGTIAAFQARAAALVMANALLVTLPNSDNLSLLSSPLLAESVLEFLRSL